MSSLATADWTTWVSIILGSGGVVSLLTLLYNSVTKRREQEVSMAQFRMRKIDTKTENYIDIITFSHQLHSFLNGSPVFSTPYYKVAAFVTAHKFVLGIYKLVEKGSFLLGDQDAETVLGDLTNFMINQFRKIYPEFEFNRFKSLNSSLEIEKIKEEIESGSNDYNKYFSMFFNWVNDPKNKSELRHFRMTSKCLSECLSFELNELYRIWYGRKFHPKKLISAESREYLLREHNFGFDDQHPKLLNVSNPSYFQKLN